MGILKLPNHTINVTKKVAGLKISTSEGGHAQDTKHPAFWTARQQRQCKESFHKPLIGISKVAKMRRRSREKRKRRRSLACICPA
eukprot:1126627-Rhodomonas_salina.1